MKLFLTWLVGVPALVAVMVLARAMSPQGFRTVQSSGAVSASCIRQGEFYAVSPSVADQRDRASCNG